jgi:negative regulator of sigma-B (phosphoserine phosphatase)
MAGPAGVIEWGVAERAIPGERESGDLHVVEPFPDGVLVAVIDALGHGPEAAAAARVACATLQQHPSEPIAALAQRCHEQLRSTRGVVMTLVSIDAQSEALTWLGIGNVEGCLVRAGTSAERRREAVLHRGGVVGFSLPAPRPATLPLAAGDLLILATDGIASGFVAGAHRGTPQQIANDILARYGKTTDDALVLVARYDGVGR